jgi:hypothetical protein
MYFIILHKGNLNIEEISCGIFSIIALIIGGILTVKK